MLQLLRNQKTQKKIYIVLAIAVITTFAVSGIYLSKEDRHSNGAIGRIGGKNITVQDYLASYKAVDHQARMIYGNAFDQVRPYINMKGEAWDRLLLLHHAEKQHVRAGDAEVVQWIASQPFLQNRGRFDDRLYRQFVTQYLHEDARRFEEEVRQTLTIGKLSERLEASSPVSGEELRNFYVQKNGERSLQYAVFSAPEDTAEISDDELKKIYPIYENFLRQPAKVKIRYALVPAADSEKFKEALGNDALTLEALASQYGLKSAETDYFARNEAIPGLGLLNGVIEKSFTLEAGKTSGWIATDQGHYKIEVADKKEPAKLSFEESREKLKEIMKHQKNVEGSLEKLGALAKDLKPGDFEKFAADQNLELKSAEHFKKGDYLPGIGPSGAVENALASLKEGEISEPVAVPGGAALVKVVKNAPIDEKKFTAEKESLKKELQKSKSGQAMDELLEKLRKELKPNLELMKEIFPEETPAAATEKH